MENTWNKPTVAQQVVNQLADAEHASWVRC